MIEHASTRQEGPPASTVTRVARRGMRLARLDRTAALAELAARLAHELRNPLAAVLAACRSLREEVEDPDHRERLDLALREVDHLLDLVSGVVHGTRLIRETARPCNVGTMVRDLTELLRLQLPETVALAVEGPDDLVCRLPQDGLQATLVNLVSDAGATLTALDVPAIRIAWDRTPGGITVQVRDNGPGLPEDLVRAAARFPLGGTFDGRRLGLAIAERFARDQGGRLRMENLPEGGAAVTLHLPCPSRS